MSWHDEIASRLSRLGKLVESAERENKQGWLIHEDLENMRLLLDQLDVYANLVEQEHGPVDTGEVHE